MKRGLMPALMSGLVCPGAGQIYNRQYIKGAVMVLVSLSLVGAAVYRTWGEMMRIAMSLPPGEILYNAAPVARRIAEANKPFYDKIAVVFLVLWVYGIIDAYIKGAKTNQPDGHT